MHILIYTNLEKAVKFCIPECQSVNPEVSEWKKWLFLENMSLYYCTYYNKHINFEINKKIGEKIKD